MVIYENVKICERTKIAMHERAMIGDFSFICCAELVMMEGAQISRFCEVSGRGRVDIGQFSTIASHCTLLTSTDTSIGIMNDFAPEKLRRVKTQDILIGDRVFIGEGCLIMPGAHIGNDAYIYPRSIVKEDVAPKKIYHAGVTRMNSFMADRNYDPEVQEEIKRRWP